MLEFYSIQDNQKTPEFPEESGLEFIGGLELETFNRLSKFGFIEKEYSFYNDFRWDSNLVGNKIKTLSDSTNSDAQKLLSLLNESAEKKSGIIAFCDQMFLFITFLRRMIAYEVYKFVLYQHKQPTKMQNDWKMREKFLKEIGLFTMSFCKLEFGITELASFTIEDLRYWEIQYESIFGLNLNHKRDLIKKFIKKEIPELYTEWEQINSEIGNLNHLRRHLIHGTGESYLFHPSIKTVIKNNGNLETKEFTTSDINKLTDRIGHACTGKNGIQGVFNTKFKTCAINWHNAQHEKHKRIVYKVNNEIQTTWKG